MPVSRARPRLIAAALIVLLHIAATLVLLRHGAARFDTDDTPENYIALAFVAAPVAQRAPPPVVLVPPVRPRRTATPRAQAAPLAIMPPDAAPDAPPETAAAASGKLDMATLRGLARQVEKERVPTALERLRTSEQMHARDDNDLARAVSQAKRPDCQTKYSGGTSLNLVMLIPLAIDTITDKGCKW